MANRNATRIIAKALEALPPEIVVASGALDIAKTIDDFEQKYPRLYELITRPIPPETNRRYEAAYNAACSKWRKGRRARRPLDKNEPEHAQ